MEGRRVSAVTKGVQCIFVREGFPAATALAYMHSTLGLNLFKIKIRMCSESECATVAEHLTGHIYCYLSAMSSCDIH